jgi:hypothetical protein
MMRLRFVSLLVLVALGDASLISMCKCIDSEPSQLWQLSHISTGANTVIYQLSHTPGANSTVHSCLTFDANNTLVMSPCDLLTALPRDRCVRLIISLSELLRHLTRCVQLDFRWSRAAKY